MFDGAQQADSSRASLRPAGARPETARHLLGSCSSFTILAVAHVTTTRFAYAAMSGSWVIRMTVFPCVVQLLEDAPCTSSRGSRVEVPGRLVGEEDRRVGDQRARDRHALLLAAGELRRDGVASRPSRPTAADRARARASAARAAESRRRRRAAEARRSRAPIVRGSRLKLWKTKPIFALRISARSSRVEPRRRRRRRARSVPDVGRSRQPRMFISVDLPEPDGPMIATNSPVAIAGRRRRGRAPRPRPCV